MMKLLGYEVHWAAANRADELAALRKGAVRHASIDAAEHEAKQIVPIRSDLVTLVVTVRGS